MPDSASASADEALSVEKKMRKFHINLLAYGALLIGVRLFAFLKFTTT
jgi:hypothetical protein